MLKKLIAALALVALLATMAACTPAGDMGDEADALLSGNEVIGTVNGVDLYRYQYDHYFSRIISEYYTNYYETLMAYQGVDMLDEESARDFLGSMEYYAWENVVQNELLRQMAVDDYGIVQDPTYLSNLLTPGFNFDFIVNRYVVDLYPKLQEAAQAEKVVSDEDMRAAYDSDPAAWDSRRTAHIIISVDSAADEAAWQAAHDQVADLIAQLDAGADFAALAEEHSQDGSAASGGEMELYFNAAGGGVSQSTSFDTDYATAAFELAEIGDYSAAPVRSAFGYHIIKLSDKKEGFEAAKEYIRASLEPLSNDELTAYFQSKLEEKRAQSEVVQLIEFKYYSEEEEGAGDAGDGAADGTDTPADGDGAAGDAADTGGGE